MTGAAARGRTLTGYGHSWVAGEGASHRSRGLVELAAAHLGLVPDNRGVGGSHSPDTTALVRREPPPPSVVYLVLTGLNDARSAGDDAVALGGYEAALVDLFIALRSANPAAITVAVVQPPLLDYSLHAPHHRGSNEVLETYNARLRAVAADHPQVLLASVDDWNPATMLDADTVHPNDAGHAAVARAVVAVAATAFR